MPTVDGFYDDLNGQRAGVGTTLFGAYMIDAPFQTRANGVATR
jgi:hypothetical protein